MDTSIFLDPFVWIQLVLFFTLLGCSAFFSGTEVALFSLNPVQLEQMAKENHPRLALIRRLLEDPRNLIATILIGNELVNVAASNLSATFLIRLLGGEDKWWVNIFIMLPLLLLIGEITPKTIAVRNNIPFAALVARPIASFMRLITPLRRVVRWVANFFITLIIGTPQEKKTTVTEEMVRTLAEQATEDGVLDDSEREYINNIFSFGNLMVKDVMVPRAKIAFLNAHATYAEAIRLFQSHNVDRVPVYEGHRDDIVGVLHVRDMVKAGPALANNAKWLPGLLRKPYFVVGSKRVSSLFQIFREKKQSMALVVDEYGGLVGLVTTKDLLETIFGEMRDKTGKSGSNIQPLINGCFRCDGVMPLSEFNQMTQANLEVDEVETLGGAILHHLGELPVAGQKITLEGWNFEVLAVENNRLTRVVACRVPEEEESPTLPEENETSPGDDTPDPKDA
ncbi:MAG: HlyC/CorC family transporter [Magnetococcales bacterium]|nr:HlyC/CorC family transporter [Magnetococcales bacterium]